MKFFAEKRFVFQVQPTNLSQEQKTQLQPIEGNKETDPKTLEAQNISIPSSAEAVSDECKNNAKKHIFDPAQKTLDLLDFTVLDNPKPPK